jgi:hypothetical protein
MLDAGAILDVVDQRGFSPLMCAAECPHGTAAAAILIESGASVNYAAVRLPCETLDCGLFVLYFGCAPVNAGVPCSRTPASHLCWLRARRAMLPRCCCYCATAPTRCEQMYVVLCLRCMVLPVWVCQAW